MLAPRGLVCLEPADREAGLRAEGVGDVIIDDLAVDDGRVFTGDHDGGVIAGAGAAAAVVGSADGVWRNTSTRVRARLDISYGGDEVTDDTAAAEARAASDIDASKHQSRVHSTQRRPRSRPRNGPSHNPSPVHAARRTDCSQAAGMRWTPRIR